VRANGSMRNDDEAGNMPIAPPEEAIMPPNGSAPPGTNPAPETVAPRLAPPRAPLRRRLRRRFRLRPRRDHAAAGAGTALGVRAAAPRGPRPAPPRGRRRPAAARPGRRRSRDQGRERDPARRRQLLQRRPELGSSATEVAWPASSRDRLRRDMGVVVSG
jgi:hypothetical protein